MPRLVKDSGYKEKATDAIIDEALKVFVKKGYKGTTMIEIAKRMGVSKGTLYQYFDSKEALFKGVLTKGVEDFRKELSNINLENDLEYVSSEQFYNSLKKLEALPPSLGLEVLQETLSNRDLDKTVSETYLDILSSFKQMLVSSGLKDETDATISALGLLSLHEGISGYEETGLDRKIINKAWRKLSRKILDLS